MVRAICDLAPKMKELFGTYVEKGSIIQLKRFSISTEMLNNIHANERVCFILEMRSCFIKEMAP